MPRESKPAGAARWKNWTDSSLWERMEALSDAKKASTWGRAPMVYMMMRMAMPEVISVGSIFFLRGLLLGSGPLCCLRRFLLMGRRAGGFHVSSLERGPGCGP